jgi:hypothetical protein
MASFCFICGISKDVFDARASSGAMGGAGGLNFAGHIATEHNMWDYMFFLIYLREKDSNDYTGIERWVSIPAAMVTLIVNLLVAVTYACAAMSRSGWRRRISRGCRKEWLWGSTMPRSWSPSRQRSDWPSTSGSVSLFYFVVHCVTLCCVLRVQRSIGAHPDLSGRLHADHDGRAGSRLGQSHDRYEQTGGRGGIAQGKPAITHTRNTHSRSHFTAKEVSSLTLSRCHVSLSLLC